MLRIIRLCYRKMIDADSQKAWDIAVFDDTHLEFYMQAQRLDPNVRFHTFQELTENFSNADQLNYLTSTAAIGYIRQLKDIVPDVANAYGKLCLPFKNFKFEIIHSHIQDKSQHKIAIWFYSESLTWIETVGNQLLIAYGSQLDNLLAGKEIETEMITMMPYLSISHLNPAAIQI